VSNTVYPESGTGVAAAARSVARPLQLYLASGSPRRAGLLHQAGIPFHALGGPGIDESVQTRELPPDYVCRMAMQKAQCGFSMLDVLAQESALVLAADTIVVLDDQILGKPASDEDAGKMLRTLSGRRHAVLTAIALHSCHHKEQQLCTTTVCFRALGDREIDAYVQSGEPRDKAGAYGIQGRAATMAKAIRGSYSGVVGLPLAETTMMLTEAGFDPFGRQDLQTSE